MPFERGTGPGVTVTAEHHPTSGSSRRLSAASGLGRGLQLAALTVLLLSVALALRMIGMGGAVTEDEDQGMGRSGNFAAALVSHAWPRTYQTGHPGVVPMWLVTLALGSERTAQLGAVARGSQQVTQLPDFLPALRQARWPFAIAGAAVVVGLAALAGRLAGSGPGLLAGALLVTDPYLAALGPIVGMDGLLAGFAAGSLLCLLLAGREPKRAVTWATVCGTLFGLAALTKTSALLLLPSLAVIGLLVARRAGLGKRRVLLAMGAALAAASAVYLLVWPAMWGQALGTLWRAVDFSARLGGAPHAPGNFLLGQVSEDPGPVFYPVALALRLGPATTLGLLGLIGLGIAARLRRPAWLLLTAGALYFLLIEVAPKKVDRYLVPLLPIADLLAAIGWWTVLRWLLRRAPLRSLRGGDARWALAGLAILVAAVQAWPLVWSGRYPLAAYNPLFGGAKVAERAIPVGWGEGLDDAAALIDQLSGGAPVTTAIWFPLWVNFQAHSRGPVVTERQIAQADYFVDYIHARQRQHTPRQLQTRSPDAVVRINGVDYARIYRLR